jgi:RNA polymerase sigma-70 factor (ECF subfamily)
MDASDEELVARTIATDDRRAYGILVRRHQGRVRAWLRQLTGDAARADDLAQDTFIRARDKLTTFTCSGKFSSWLLKIGYNLFLQELRDTKRVQRLATAIEAQNTALEANFSPAAGSGLPDLPKMLSILSDDERAVMILCHAYGYSHGEASEVTGLPLGTLKSHLRRSTLKIREQFNIGNDEHD